jgi:dephospho-CoA kinase
MRIVGLTGSIGMGKSTTSGLFAEAGAAVYDADAAVHELYGPGGAAVEPVGAAFPGVIVDGGVDRARLSKHVMGNPEALKALEQIVHPLVGGHRQTFFEQARRDQREIVILDVPLLFETGGDRALDAVVVVSAPSDMQRARVLARPDMTPEKLDAILARQTPDSEKRQRADFVIDTSTGLDAARNQVQDIMQKLMDPTWASTRSR